MAGADAAYAGSIPEMYDRYLGGLLFEPFALEVARRARDVRPARILETAAGTGLVTAALHESLPDAEIVATDLNEDMLAVAAGRIASGKVQFHPADALDLPFDDGSFDLAVCQFGVMFFPDKVKGNAEVHRVLRNGGTYVAVIWDSLARNEVSRIVTDAVADMFPDDPPQFLARAPYGYADVGQIERDMQSAGFKTVRTETVALDSFPTSASDAARGLVAGCPLGTEVEERDPGGLERAVAAAEDALRSIERNGVLQSRVTAHIVTATR